MRQNETHQDAQAITPQASIMSPMYKIGVLTSSDMGARGEREDTSGELIKELLALPDYEHTRYSVVPDERAIIEQTLTTWADDDDLDLIMTTGGTGLTDRDVMPEATRAVVERLAPGLAEAMRAFGLTKTPMAMLSRGIAGVRGRTLIINLPGSPKGVREGIEVLLPVLGHALGQLTGENRGH
jgi:molybdopterin adenylyltransferase